MAKNCLFGMNTFKSGLQVNMTKEFQESHGIDTYSDTGGGMDIYQRTESQFLPPGKTLEELTPEELRIMRLQYRFDYYKPGIYQGITGFGQMM